MYKSKITTRISLTFVKQLIDEDAIFDNLFKISGDNIGIAQLKHLAKGLAELNKKALEGYTVEVINSIIEKGRKQAENYKHN